MNRLTLILPVFLLGGHALLKVLRAGFETELCCATPTFGVKEVVNKMDIGTPIFVTPSALKKCLGIYTGRRMNEPY